jgi:hypothetical protein
MTLLTLATWWTVAGACFGWGAEVAEVGVAGARRFVAWKGNRFVECYGECRVRFPSGSGNNTQFLT